MNYRDPQLREQLAGEYVLGTLSGRARRRFERLLRRDVALRELVAAWERRLTPLVDAVEPVTPPRRVWREVERRTAPAGRPGVWQHTGFWRSLALAASMLAVVLAVFIYVVPPRDVATGYVAVLNDQQAQPGWVVSAASFTQITVKTLKAPPPEADRSYELWLLPGGDNPPRSLGLLPVDGQKVVTVPAELREAMAAGKVLAVSVEPKGGSPTGLPTGPVLYQGVLLATS